jgi:hypothetical protein
MAIALFTGAVLLVIQSMFWSRVISVPASITMVGVFVLSYFRPQNGLLVLAAFAPLAGLWEPLLAERMRSAEAVVLAFLAGVLLRGWALHRFRDLVPDRLQLAALAFGAIVAGSCVHQLWTSGVDARAFADYVLEHYLTSVRSFSSLFHAMLLLEGMALLVYSAHCCRTQPQIVPRLVRMLVIGAVAAALFNAWFLVHELIETGEPGARFAEFLLMQRWSAHVGDVNAAGSFFAMGAIAAFGLMRTSTAHRSRWAMAGLITGTALWMTRSRTALAAALVVGLFSFARLIARRSLPAVRLAAIGVVATAAAVTAFSGQSVLSQAAASTAVRIRWMFLETTSRMLQAHPLFGVGIGQYLRWSGHFSSPELRAFYPRENAHNNFAQIAGELGLAGFAAFVAVLAVSLLGPGRSRRGYPEAMPMLAGVAAFIVSWLGGHPLLVPEVAYPFWLALGIVAGAASDIISPPHG